MLLGEATHCRGNLCWKTNGNIGDCWFLIHATSIQLNQPHRTERERLAQAWNRLTAWVKTQRLAAA